MRKVFNIKSLDRVAIIGVGLLGGSLGLALRAAGFRGTLVGAGRRASSLRKALTYGAVDLVTQDPAEAAAGTQLIVICTPIGQFEPILRSIADSIAPETYLTDVASVKLQVVRLAERLLPPTTRFVGSHPMAGSEQTGVEFARADLFERSLCLLTPTARTGSQTVQWMHGFWEAIGGRCLALPPRRHDELLAGASHLPHAVATALVNLAARNGGIRLAGPGFADTTRIASGDPSMWTEILRTNRPSMLKALDALISDLGQLRRRLDQDDARWLEKWLGAGKHARDQWVSERYKKKVLPP